MAEDRPMILVTGGAGYIGSHVVLALLDDGYDVVVLDNLSTGERSAVDPRATFAEGEVAEVSAVAELMGAAGVKAVIHLAASISAEESVSEPLKYYRNNTATTVALLQACMSAGVDRVVFSSTAAVYGAPPVAMVDETCPCRPVTPYGGAKLMSEQVLADVARAHAIKYCALRYFNVAGADPKGRAGQRSGAKNLIKVALDATLGRRPALPVFGDDFETADGSGVRDYIHVSDLASAHLLVLHRLLADEPVPVVLNCGYGHGHSVFEVIRTIGDVTGRAVPWEQEGRRPGDLAAVIADNSRIADLGWRPAHDNLEAMIADAYAWELAVEAGSAATS